MWFLGLGFSNVATLTLLQHFWLDLSYLVVVECNSKKSWIKKFFYLVWEQGLAEKACSRRKLEVWRSANWVWLPPWLSSFDPSLLTKVVLVTYRQAFIYFTRSNTFRIKSLKVIYEIKNTKLKSSNTSGQYSHLSSFSFAQEISIQLDLK